MSKKSLISAFFMFLISLLLVSTFKTEVFAKTTPKVAIVSLEHVPFVAGDNINVKYSLRNTPEGTYIVDLWAKNNESNSKYDGWKLKVITIKNTITKDTSIILNKTTASLIVGEAEKLIVIDVPSSEVTWKSSNPEIVTIDNT